MQRCGKKKEKGNWPMVTGLLPLKPVFSIITIIWDATLALLHDNTITAAEISTALGLQLKLGLG